MSLYSHIYMASLGQPHCCLLRCHQLHFKGLQGSHFQKPYAWQFLILCRSELLHHSLNLFPVYYHSLFMHFHTCTFLTPVTRTPLSTSCFVCTFLSLLSLKHFVRQTLTSPPSPTLLQILCCILHQYCHDHFFSLLHIECCTSTKRSCDMFLSDMFLYTYQFYMVLSQKLLVNSNTPMLISSI